MNLPRAIFSLLLLIVLIASPANCRADVEVTKTGDCVVDAEALTIAGRVGSCINGQAFQQNALMSFGGHQYICWYNAKRRVCLGRRKLPKGDWEIITFTDYYFEGRGNPNDTHNTISIGICPVDGTIHLSFDHHMDPLNYRVSSRGAAMQPDKTEWTPELFGPIRHELRKGYPMSVTYPRFIITPDDKLQFFYRKGHRSSEEVRVLHTYNPETGTWSSLRPIIAENGYTNYHTRYGKDGRLHLMWHWRGTGQLCYLYTPDQGKTWKNNSGNTLLTADDAKSANKSDKKNVSVINTKQATHIMLGGQYIDSKGRPHEIVWHIPDNVEPREYENTWEVWARPQSRYHHYWRDNKGGWHSNMLPTPVGNRAKILLDAHDNAYAIFMLNKTEKWDWQIYFSHGELAIATASAESMWTDWKVIHREPGPFLNQAHFDDSRWESDGVLSVFAQDSPEKPHLPTALRVLDFQIDRK
ncbi:MAG: BNR repeat-containing protein [Planctomycetota bacterium]|jgi:hypothetical protein